MFTEKVPVVGILHANIHQNLKENVKLQTKE